MKSAPITAVIVGAGHRALLYAGYAKNHPDRLKIVGVADPSGVRREAAAREFGLLPDQCFSTAGELAAGPKRADAVINGTMDNQHVPTTLPLLDAGYDVLLEKPFAVSIDEIRALAQAVRKTGRKVMICHVLRYAPFYVEIRSRVAGGQIGEVVNIQTTEHVSYHHMAVGFIRGKWRKKDDCGSPMLLAKCCHDLDLVAWMKSGIHPSRAGSFGGLTQFKSEKAPDGSGRRCMVDCTIEGQCPYSARKHYIERNWWNFYSWESLEHVKSLTDEAKRESLRTDNPFGRCVWRCDNDVVDHQSVVVEFADGCTATHNMVGGVAMPSRSMHLIGTAGEIYGSLETSRFAVRRLNPDVQCGYSEETVDLNVQGDMHGMRGGHGGGDLLLVRDFVDFLQGSPPSISCTTIDDSISGHLIALCAEQARLNNTIVDIPKL
ncbi:MAG: Gfo/Idh/MocA family oxidoreductase [Planctomycetes bacterium]|nr:Gfo/Idh/MocA family oxidoreductase [Planctomycetota bacterium]